MCVSFIMNRRDYLNRSALLAIMAGMGVDVHSSILKSKLKLKVSACDWSIGKNCDPGAFEIAKQIGLQGVQVNLGIENNNVRLRQTSMRQTYREISKKFNIEISSLALGELNSVPYKSDPRTETWVSDAIDVAGAFDVHVILLAFFDKNDLRNDASGKEEVIQRLKKVAPKAEKLGVTLGIESYLSAAEHQEIIQRVGSKSIKVYLDFRNTADAGYDVLKELRQLGRNAICELHIKENGKLLSEGTLDWHKIGETLASISYRGEENWMQIEWSLPEGMDVVKGYQHNLKYIKEAFGLN